MWNYIRNKLGIARLEQDVRRIPALNERYLKLLTPMESLMHTLNKPEGDDSLVMHHMRSMGYFGGHAVRDAYLKGQKESGRELDRQLQKHLGNKVTGAQINNVIRALDELNFAVVEK